MFCRWKLLEFAELKRSSISFFDIEKPETAISRWSRARMKAAKVRSKEIDVCVCVCVCVSNLLYRISKYQIFYPLQVGKGLSKDAKARKLALLHWLEAVRYSLEIKLWNGVTGLLYLILILFSLSNRLIHGIVMDITFNFIMSNGFIARARSLSSIGKFS